jgi:GntR family transcriptional regulator
MIPNEGDMAREFGVSPGTMRKALELMETMRLLTRRQGRGTFVNDPSSENLAARYSNVRNADGTTISGEVTCGEVVEKAASERECERLWLNKEDRVFRFQRMRLDKGRPYLLEDVSVPTALFPGLGDEQDPSPGVSVLAALHSILLGKAEERVTIGGASVEVAEALAVPLGSPVMNLDRVVFGLDGRPVEWRLAWCHLADCYYLAQMK